MPSIFGGNQLDTGYEISNSLRFNRGDSPNLERTFSGSPTSTKKCTISFWTKLADTTDTNAKNIFSAIKSGVNEDFIKFMGVNNGILNNLELGFNNTNSGGLMSTGAGSSDFFKFRDQSAWYHIVIAIDSSQGTADNRVKLYVNGNQIGLNSRVEGGSQIDDTPLTQDYELGFLTASKHQIGENVDGSSEHYDGYLAEFYFVDGQQYDPTYFGEFNDDNVWIPVEKDKGAGGTIAFGNYGFLLEFKETGTSQNSSGIGADTSGNDNHFAVGNLAAIDVTEDTPTNNFCTLNTLVPHHSIFNTTTEGNTGLSSSGVQLRGGHFGTTIMPSNGKWYFEVKILQTGSSDRTGISIANFESVAGDDHIEGGDFKGFTISTGTLGRIAVTSGSTTNETDISAYQYSDNDIAIFAVDMDASTPRVYVGKNGTWYTTSAGSGGDPASNTGYFEVVLGNHFSVGARHSAGTSTSQSYLYNFGNPAFTISSGNSDGKYGNFEYAPPSGYYAICTKRLGEFG